MTRKKYIHKVQMLVIAIYNHPDSIYPEGYRLGEGLKRVKEAAKYIPERFGSYEAAWNSKAAKWAREYYGVD